MTTGSWSKSNGVTTASLATPVSIVWTRSWTGADSWPPRTPPHAVVRRDEDGKPIWFDPEGRPYARHPVAPTAPEAVKPRQLERTVNAVQLIPAALKLREELHLGPSPSPFSIYPGWNPQRVPKRARFAENAYTMTERRMVSVVCKVEVSDLKTSNPRVCWPSTYQYVDLMQHFGATTWAPVSLLTANDQIRLIGKLREKIQGSDFNMSVFVAEGPQALQMIADFAKRTALSLGSLKKGRVLDAVRHLVEGPKMATPLRELPNVRKLERAVKVATSAEYNAWLQDDPKRRMDSKGRPRKGMERRFLKQLDLANSLRPTGARDFSNWWLSISFGWIPLAKDAESAAQLLAHHLNVPGEKRYRAWVRRESTTVRPRSRTCCKAPTGVAKGGGMSVRTHKRQIIAVMSEKTQIPKLLGLTSLESVAWELTPWSFIADWAIPISQWLEARGFAQGLTGTFITTETMTGVNHVPFAEFVEYTAPAGIPIGYSQVNFSRTISSILDVPKPHVKPLRDIPTWKRAADALALLLQVGSSNRPGLHSRPL